MVKLVFYITLFFFIYSAYFIKAENLNTQEKIYFNFLDLNNDNFISLEEINQTMKLIFQLIDENYDGQISQEEIFELKDIIELLS